MNRVFRFVALLLLALWLPVTKHCLLEAAGVFEGCASEASTGCCGDSEPCTKDNCDLVGARLVSQSCAAPKVPAAQLHEFVSMLCVLQWEDRVAVESSFSAGGGGVDVPLDWVPAWHFEHRTAPPSRAPSFA